MKNYVRSGKLRHNSPIVCAVATICFVIVLICAYKLRPGRPEYHGSIVNILEPSGGVARFHKLLEENKDSSQDASLTQLRASMAQLQQPLKDLTASLQKKKATTDKDSDNDVAPSVDEASKPWKHRLQYHHRWNRGNTIFVGLVGKATTSVCGASLEHLFNNAAAPSDVSVGVVEVHTPQSIVHNDSLQLFSGCLSPSFALCNMSKFCPIDHIRVRRVVEADVEGDRSALNFTTSMYRNEKYVLLLGSMSEAASLPKDWDMTLREQLGKVQGKAVLTAQRTGSGASGIPCQVTFNETVGVVDIVAEETASNSGSLKQLPVCSTELLFGESSLIFDAPLPRTAVATGAGTGYDFLYSLALFEKGYRVYGAAILGQRTSDKGADYITTESSVRATATEVASLLADGRRTEVISEKALSSFEEQFGIKYRGRVSPQQWCKK